MKFDLSKESINYVKINYLDNDNFAHYTKAAVRFIGELEFLASTKSEEALNIPAPQEVELGIACDNGLYKAKTVLKKVEFEDPYILFTMRKPEEMEYQQNREYFRVKLQENINITYVKEEQEHSLSALTYDLSAKGVRIELDNEIDFPEEVILSLFLQNKIIEVKAKYVRTDNDDNIKKASFQFVDLKEPDLDYISQICFKIQLEERRKNLL